MYRYAALGTQLKLLVGMIFAVALFRAFSPDNARIVFVALMLIGCLHAVFTVRHTLMKAACIGAWIVVAQYLDPLCDPEKPIEWPGFGAIAANPWLIAGGVAILVAVIWAWTAGAKDRGADHARHDKAASDEPEPTEKQLAYAQKIAVYRGLEIPADCLESRSKMSAFIARNVRK